MDVSTLQSITPTSFEATQRRDAGINVDPERERAQRNAMNLLQARYGEKPKEARSVHKQLDKDDFMKIMLTEMKHQDPTKPMDADKMAAQMAQLTSVEQMKNMNASMDKLVEKNNGTDRLAMSAMIGKQVTVDKGRFVHTKGTISPLEYTLPQDAGKVKISVLDDRGEEIFSRELEPQKSGLNTYNWEGLGANGVPVKSGSYAVRVDAETDKGAKIKIDPIAHENIVGVSFDGGDTNFLVGDPKQPQKIPMRSVVKIEGEAMLKSVQAEKAAQSAKAASGAPAVSDSFLPDVFKEKIAKQTNANQQPGAAVAQAVTPDEPVQAEGFANGLHE